MSQIHYFQRYTQKENVATNNTMLLLSRLYHYSPTKFHSVLMELVEVEDLQVGVYFTQQSKSKNSIPDAVIEQHNFKVVIETKLHNKFDVSQLNNHLKSFNNESVKLLLSLSPSIPSTEKITEIEQKIQAFNHDKDTTPILYFACTFKHIIDAVNDVLEDRDYELKDIIKDYEDYCLGSGLIKNSEFLMRAAPCGKTLQDNLKFNLYYMPTTRSYREHPYIGLYGDKSIRAVGLVSNIIVADYINNHLHIHSSTHAISDAQKRNIIDAMEQSRYKIKTEHQFFCVDKFHLTDYKKTSKFPMQGASYFDLKTILNLKQITHNIEELAQLLRHETW